MRTRVARPCASRLPWRTGSDRGFTLIEMMVAMLLFSIFIAVAMSAVMYLTRTTISAQARATSASSILTGFQNLDRQVRYASDINYPGVSPTGASYVEFRTAAGARKDLKNWCSQWRYMPSTGVIQMREWEDVAGRQPGAWQTKVTGVSGAASPTYPFTMIPATAGVTATQRLGLKITAGGVNSAAQTDISTTYVARNSSISSPSNVDANNNGASDTPVCSPTGVRP